MISIVIPGKYKYPGSGIGYDVSGRFSVMVFFIWCRYESICEY